MTDGALKITAIDALHAADGGVREFDSGAAAFLS